MTVVGGPHVHQPTGAEGGRLVKANQGRQGHWLMLFVEVLPLFHTPIIFHPLAFRPSFQVCRALVQRVGGTTKRS